MLKAIRLVVPALAALLWLCGAPARAEATPVQPRPALWKVEDADTTIYLFGTIHALPAGVDWFNGPVAGAFAQADELVTEVAESSPTQMQGAVMEMAVLPAGSSLRDQIAPADRPAFEQALGKLGMPPAALDRFEAWYAAIALATLPLARDGFTTENGVEALLDSRARDGGKPHIGLETAAFQLSLFDSLPPEVQHRYLREVVKSLPDLKTEIAAMTEAWQHGDAERLAQLVNEDESDPVLMQALLVNRNRTWAEWIRQRMDRPGAVFMAVGAGHLAGKDSVQDFLRGHGLTAQRVQ